LRVRPDEPRDEFEIDQTPIWPAEDGRLEPIFLPGLLWIEFEEFEPLDAAPMPASIEALLVGFDEFEQLDPEPSDGELDEPPPAPRQRASAVGLLGSLGVHLLTLLILMNWSSAPAGVAGAIPVHLVIEETPSAVEEKPPGQSVSDSTGEAPKADRGSTTAADAPPVRSPKTKAATVARPATPSPKPTPEPKPVQPAPPAPPQAAPEPEPAQAVAAILAEPAPEPKPLQASTPAPPQASVEPEPAQAAAAVSPEPAPEPKPTQAPAVAPPKPASEPRPVPASATPPSAPAPKPPQAPVVAPPQAAPKPVQVAAAPPPAPKPAPAATATPTAPTANPTPAAIAAASASPSAPTVASGEAQASGAAPGGGDYLNYLKVLTRGHLDILPLSFLAGRHGRTILSILVFEDGTISRIAVKRSSGYPDIDARIEQMVAAVGRFPPVPESFQRPAVELDFDMTFPDALQH
jgi:TonB family protein